LRIRPPEPRLFELLSAYDPRVTAIALALRELVLQEAPQAKESYASGYAVGIAFYFTGPFKDGFCHIATYAHHVNLGFNQGATHPDPEKVLESAADLRCPYLRAYIRMALDQVGGPKTAQATPARMAMRNAGRQATARGSRKPARRAKSSNS
jgi:hypothetical protein